SIIALLLHKNCLFSFSRLPKRSLATSVSPARIFAVRERRYPPGDLISPPRCNIQAMRAEMRSRPTIEVASWYALSEIPRNDATPLVVSTRSLQQAIPWAAYSRISGQALRTISSENALDVWCCIGSNAEESFGTKGGFKSTKLHKEDSKEDSVRDSL